MKRIVIIRNMTEATTVPIPLSDLRNLKFTYPYEGDGTGGDNEKMKKNQPHTPLPLFTTLTSI